MKSDPPAFRLSRRRFVSALSVAGVMAGVGRGAARAGEAASAPAAAAGNLGPTTLHVMSKPMFKLSYAETAKLIADAGYGGIDYTVRVPQGHVLPQNVQEDLPRAVDAAHAAGLKVEMITTEISSLREPHAETTIRTAARLGVKCYRLGYWNYDPKLGVIGTLEKLQPSLRELAAFNASLGIHGAIQNHSGTRVGGAVWDLFELLRGIDPQGLGVQYDIRHAVVEGGASWSVGLKVLRPWIRCTDMKDFKWVQSPGRGVIEDVPLGEGIVPLDAYLKLYRELGMSGPMSVHFEYPPFERPPQPLAPDLQRTEFARAMKRDFGVLRAAMEKQKVA